MRWLAGILALLLGANTAMATPPNVILSAEYGGPTTRYAHGVLGDAAEWSTLSMRVDMCMDCEITQIRTFTLTLPENRVFEDLAPRIIRDEDGLTHVMVVESDIALGARLALYDESGLVDATPFIGRSNRWLAPIGAADLDGDGLVELAYVEKPHLSKELKIWRLDQGKLSFVKSKTGFTNHRIDWDYIVGGIRTCAGASEMITADADWSNVMAITLGDQGLTSRRLAAYSRANIDAAMDCGL